MTRTEKLLYTLVVLVVSFILFLFFQNFEKINSDINKFITSMKEPKINIPNDKTIYNRKYSYKTVHETNNFIPKNIDDLKNIYYTILNKGWDEFTFYCDKDYESCADDVKTIANDSEYINLINNYVSPFNSYKKYNTLVTGDKEIYLSIDKTYTKEQTEYLTNYFNNLIDSLKIDRKNIIIKKLSMIIYEMVTELGDIQELVAYSGNFDDMQTLLDCILDESTDNEHSISSILEHLEKSEVVK